MPTRLEPDRTLPVASRVCRVLEEDPELAAQLDAAVRERAARECRATEIRLEPGRWSAESAADAVGRGVGLLVLAGLLTRRVSAEGRAGAELLGEGDLVRPWEDDGAVASVPLEASWWVLTPTRLAVLDVNFAARASAYPQLVGAFAERAVRRARNLAANMAIVHHPRVDVRLHMLFWRLADRWGTVHTDGVRVRLPVTHAALADLVAARRPTVSSALSELAQRGALERAGDTWWLYGGPPGDLLPTES